METLKENDRTEREQARNVPASCKTMDPIEEAVARAICDAWEHPTKETYWDAARQAIAAHLAALEAAGLVVVPLEPTEAMLEAGSNRWETHHPGLAETYPNERATYRAMIAASPK